MPTPLRLALAGAVLLLTAAPMADAGEPLGVPSREMVATRSSVSINGSSVRLGDVFANAGKHADTRISRAPRPGQQMVLDARTLYQLASKHGLPWQPHLGNERVVIERESHRLSMDMMVDYLRDAMGRQGIDPESLQISLQDSGRPIYVAAAADVRVDGLRYDTIGGRFSAVLTAEAAGEAPVRIGLQGRAHRTVQLPVLRRTFRHGEVIGNDDIDWQVVRERQVPRNVVVDGEFLVGLTPRRMIRAGTPIRTGDLGRPILVERNSLVSITLRTPTMVLTMRGKALDDAAEGQTVRVRNLRGRNVVEGIVTKSGDVLLDTSVAPPAGPANSLKRG